ncbi:MAG: hypothetical protein QXT64_05400 [Desulfurococcaceae archaeon]
MDARTEVLKRLLVDVAREWIERSREAIGEEQYELLSRQLQKFSEMYPLETAARWLLRIVSDHADIAYTGKRLFEVWWVREGIDPRSTRQLLAVIHMCLR